jgi:hypothetical protein
MATNSRQAKLAVGLNFIFADRLRLFPWETAFPTIGDSLQEVRVGCDATHFPTHGSTMKRFWSITFFLIACMMAFAAGALAAWQFARMPSTAQGYSATVERLWERIANPHKRHQCQNALRQISLAIPPVVQEIKESK